MHAVEMKRYAAAGSHPSVAVHPADPHRYSVRAGTRHLEFRVSLAKDKEYEGIKGERQCHRAVNICRLLAPVR